MLFVCVLEYLIRFFKLHNLRGQLHIASLMLVWCNSVAQVVLHTLPCVGLFQSPVLFILTALSNVMGILHAPMLLA